MAAPKAPVLSATGASKEASLDAAIFGGEVKPHLVHEAVRAEQAAQRAGRMATKSRGLVSGGRSKPWRQKGTGRARQGSIRAPHWRGGGVAHGPKPRDYSQRTPKKMIRLALRSALSDRARDGKVLVVDDWGIDEPKTKPQPPSTLQFSVPTLTPGSPLANAGAAKASAPTVAAAIRCSDLRISWSPS